MSWLSRSIANSLRIDDDDDDSDNHASPSHRHPESTDDVEERDPRGGVKEDLTEFKQSLTRQLWGVANFLAPPAPSQTTSTGEHDDDHRKVLDKRRDVREEENLDDEDEEEEEEEWMRGVVGLTEEVLTFAGNVAHHPETWLDFPVEDDEDFDDIPMSESQKRHTQAVEHLTPTLAALRIELCPAYMSMGFFWKVYFVLLHSRLTKQDAKLLSTPEVVEARVKWMQELQKRAKESDRYFCGHYGTAEFDEDSTPRSLQNEHSETMSSWTFASEPATSSTAADSDTEKQVATTEMQSANTSIMDMKPMAGTGDKNIVTAPVFKKPPLKFDDDEDDDDWPEDDCLGPDGKVIPVGFDGEDISFSDLEDDDCCIPVVSKPKFTV